MPSQKPREESTLGVLISLGCQYRNPLPCHNIYTLYPLNFTPWAPYPPNNMPIINIILSRSVESVYLFILPYHPCFRHAKRTHIRKICIPVCVPLYGFIICSILRLELCLNTLKCCCDYLVHIIILVLSKSSAEYYILACLCKLLVLLVKRIVLVVVYRVVWLYARLPLC